MRKPKISVTRNLAYRNALFAAIAVILFEVGYLAGRIGDRRVGKTLLELFLTDLDTSGVTVVNSSSPQGLQQQPSSPVSVRSIDENVNRPHVPPPLSLKQIFPLTRNSPDAEFHLKHKWSQPLVIQSYVRYKADVKDGMEVVLITTGVSMGSFQRNFTGAGCMIGNHVYPVDEFRQDKAICTVPKGITKGQHMTLVIFKDEVVEAALEGPVTITKGFVAELEEGDLLPLKNGTKLHGALEEVDPEGLLAVNSRIMYSEQLDPYSPSDYKALPRYEICLATQIKPSTDLLPDWLDYHRRLGADFVYVFDNHAEEDVSALLAHRHDVEVLYWPWEKSQIQAFTYSLYAMRARCEWVFLMDTDEYVMVGLDGSDSLSKRALPPLKEYIREKEKAGYAQVKFHWLIMKNSGYEERPDKPVPEAYVHREDPQLKSHASVTLGKTAISMNYNWVRSNAHARLAGEKARKFHNYSDEFYPKRINDTGMIVHYRKRSWVEYQEKLQSGRANINNPMSVSYLEKWGSGANDERKGLYMRLSESNRKEYTHFRDIWRRVSRELRVGNCVTRRFVDEKWCRTFYNLSNSKGMELMKEECQDMEIVR